MTTTKPPLEGGRVVPLHLLSPPEGSSSDWELREEWAKEKQQPSGFGEDIFWLPRERKLRFKKWWDKGTGFDLPATWALYCLYF